MERVNDIEAIIDRRDRLREEQARLESGVNSIEADLDQLEGLNNRNQSIEEDIEEIRDHIDGLSAFTDWLTNAMDERGN